MSSAAAVAATASAGSDSSGGDHSEHAGHWRVDVPTSPARTTTYLRTQWCLAKAYARVYYDSARWWKRAHYCFAAAAIAMNLGSAVACLAVGNPIATYAAGALSLSAAAVVAVNTEVKPGEQRMDSEKSGDAYTDVADSLSLYDPHRSSLRRAQRVVRQVAKQMQKLRYRSEEPDPGAVEHYRRRIVEQVRHSREDTMLHARADADEESHALMRRDTLVDLERGLGV